MTEVCNYFCYILRNKDPKYRNHTYNGMTNNPKRRIRQHNGEIKGGAVQTTRVNPKDKPGSWEIYALLSGFPSKINCLSCEWRIKKPLNKGRKGKMRGPMGRIRGLNLALHTKRWTSKCTDLNCDMPLQLWVVKEYAHIIRDYTDEEFAQMVQKLSDKMSKNLQRELPKNLVINVVDEINLDDIV